MSTTEIMDYEFDMPKNRSNVIKVIGVGGGGSNAINHMYQQGIEGVDFVICNTDSQALENSSVPIKVQLGVNLTEGLGAGANPEVGEQAALESFEDIKDLLDTNTKMVFITAGMGGGTGTGAAPVIAKQARDMEILTVGIVTIPFKFEGKVRNQQAHIGVENLRRNVDSLIVIDNNKLREVYGNLGFKSGFSKADEVLSTAARGIAEVITHHYTQNIDLRDAKTVLSNSGTAIMGSSTASGENRAKDAIKKALDSPLLNDNKITGAKNVLLLIVSGSQEITLDEIGEINDHIQEEAGNNANIIMGVGEDSNLGESIAVTIIATGFNKDQQNEIVNTETKKIIHTLEEEQTATHNLSVQNKVIPTQNRLFEEPILKQPKAAVEIEELPEEEEKSETELIPTTELIKDIEVNYKEVLFDADDFIFLDSNSDELEEEKPVVEEEEPMLVFDFPIAETKAENTVKNKPVEDSKKQYEIQPKKTEETSQVNQQIELFPGSEKSGEKRYNLEDYLEKERELQEAKPMEEEPELIADPGTPRDRSSDSAVDSKNSDSPEMDYSSRAKRQEKHAYEEESEKRVNPLNSSIAEGLAARASERRARMKKFNYKFRKHSNIEEIEKQPAYKRAGVELEKDTSMEEKDQWSRSSVNFNENEEPKISRNNSYLHDNVD